MTKRRLGRAVPKYNLGEIDELCSAVPMSEYDSDVIDEERAAFDKRLKQHRRTMAKSG